ncbi:MAG: hypothetical protein ACRDL7_10320, partial [Gaiellaceae bacterium]
LMRSPSITSRGEHPFTLYGTVIDLFGGGKQLHRVLARGAGKAVSESGTVTSDTLDFLMADGGLARMYAWGPSRARAVNPQYDILADSLDVRTPGQRVREIRALRRAVALSLPDTVKLKTRERDWMHGDTILARFDSTAPITHADSATQPAMHQLVALGRASSYYKIAAKDSSAVGPAINYVRGGSVTIAFHERQVASVTVTDSVAGVYIEPTPPPKKKADSTAAPAATATKSPTP